MTGRRRPARGPADREEDVVLDVGEARRAVGPLDRGVDDAVLGLKHPREDKNERGRQTHRGQKDDPLKSQEQ